MSLPRIVNICRVLSRYSSHHHNLAQKPGIQQPCICRYISVDRPKQTKTLKNEKEKVRMYIVQRYIDYVKNYATLLESRFPTAVKMYRVFSIGIKDFLKDLKRYCGLRVRVARSGGGEGGEGGGGDRFSSLSRADIELYYRMPGDMWRIAPVLVLSAVPFGNYIIFPLALLRPRALLCSHFWSLAQRAEFSRLELAQRLHHYKPVLRALQAGAASAPGDSAPAVWTAALGRLGSGLHPSPSHILQCKQLFTGPPYGLNYLTYAHMKHLLRAHGVRWSGWRRRRLRHVARLLLAMDAAVRREGGVAALPPAALRAACTLRGLHAAPLPLDELRDWFTDWLTVTEQLDQDSASLVLHLPILLAYNHPQNWKLIY